MTSFVKFTPVSGAFNDDPLCYLLEIDQTKILLDCGSDESFSNLESLLAKLKRLTKTIDVILLSHATVFHIGAVPYIYKKMGLNCPIYATIPVSNFAPLVLIDLLRARKKDGPFEFFSVQDIKDCFSVKCAGLRFLQNMPVLGGALLAIPYAAGHSLGGAIWRLRKETEEIVYAVDYNHRKERHLNATALETLLRPTLLITDTRNALTPQITRKHRDTEIIDAVLSTLRRDGDVLIPTDSSARSLELAFMLESYWKENSLSSYPIVFLSTYSNRIIEYCKSTLEWMSDAVKASYDRNPFDFKFVKLFQKLEQVKMITVPKVVITTTAGMNCGFSRDLFTEWAGNPDNLILFTSKNPGNTLARKITDRIDDSSLTEVAVHLLRREPLQGEELRKHLRDEKERSDRVAAEAALAKYREKEDSDDDDADLAGDDEAERERKNVLMIQQELYWTMSQFDLYVRDIYASCTGGLIRSTIDNRMFPFFDRKPKFDEYGEAINPEDYIRPEDIEMEAQAKRLEEMKVAAAQREDWEDEIAEPAAPSKWVSYSLNVRLSCQRKFIDFEGLCDSKAMLNIIGRMNPRKIIFVHGDTEPTQFLLRRCRNSEFLTNEIFAPQIMEQINVSNSTNIYQVKLTDALLSSLHAEKVGDYELSYISGTVHFPESIKVPSSPSLMMDVEDGGAASGGQDEQPDENSKSVVVPFLDLTGNEASMMTTTVSDLSSFMNRRAPVFVGDLKLSEFRNICHRAGLQTDFYAGDLVLNQSVVVKKSDSGQLTLEGSLSPTYYRVRELLYGQHAIL